MTDPTELPPDLVFPSGLGSDGQEALATLAGHTLKAQPLGFTLVTSVELSNSWIGRAPHHR